MIKKILVFSILFIGSTSYLFAADVVQLFKEANQLYADGKFTEAVKTYEKAAQVKPTAEIYYNLGNAYFKNKELGKAILNYERARKLDPRDPDIISNLSYANRLIEYKIEDKRNWYIRKLSELIGYFKYEECWPLFLVSYFVFLVNLLISFIRKRPLFGKLTTVLFSFVIISALPLVLKFAQTGMSDEAVTTVKQAEVRYGPSTLDQIAFRLAEGLKVSVHDHKQDWYRIRLRDGRSGWVPESDITII